MQSNKKGIFISGESGVIPLAIQKILKNNNEYYVVNDQDKDPFNIKHLKKHQSFAIRQPELDFTDRHLLFSKELKEMWSNTDIIVHSGAYVGTDFCAVEPHKTIEVNITGTDNLVKIASMYDLRFVYFSTTAIFDPTQYSRYTSIKESTQIKPQTLYGITKYAGEQIVDRLYDNQKSMIVRPVFGFSDYPDDLHSALTKFLYVMYKNEIDKQSNTLTILLNQTIGKNYTRVENIAQIVVDLIKNSAWGEKINVGDSAITRKDWHEMFDIIKHYIPTKKSSLSQLDYIDFKQSDDYLHWHNIDNSKMLELINKKSVEDIENYISFNKGIEYVVESLKQNSDLKPYWI